MFLIAACAPEPKRVLCMEKATNKTVITKQMMAGWEIIYVYYDDNGLRQSITPKSSRLWRCVAPDRDRD
ncbi:hypothetical protein [Sphingopyxis sp. 113P3]|uniref:hypothetical protein n=1 Tax=Sphingopyxis sp. (strain 113P3) TaxID=292913 RepID=UPI0011875928|nr:hypothetical protein [Sphingopyxis sp. 113P3]